MARVTVEIDPELMPALKKRAKKNYFSVTELVEDIVRRSMMSYKGGTSKKKYKLDDKLVGIFSRERRGRKPKRKKK
jgi:hypothetical protein